MSSGVSREDVEQALWLTGIRDPRMIAKLMRTIDAYVYHASRDMVANEIARLTPEISTVARQRTYRCVGDCRQYKVLEEFPVRKQQNPRIPSPCTWCDNHRVTMEDAGRNRVRSLSFRDEKIG